MPLLTRMLTYQAETRDTAKLHSKDICPVVSTVDVFTVEGK